MPLPDHVGPSMSAFKMRAHKVLKALPCLSRSSAMARQRACYTVSDVDNWDEEMSVDTHMKEFTIDELFEDCRFFNSMICFSFALLGCARTYNDNGLAKPMITTDLMKTATS
jgi:hypothetical protein